MPQRFRLSRARGWRMPLAAASVARPTAYGNPFRVEMLGRELAVEMFRDTLAGHFHPGKVAHLAEHDFRAMMAERERWMRRLGSPPGIAARRLRGFDLGCWCALGDPCHGDVWLEWANR